MISEDVPEPAPPQLAIEDCAPEGSPDPVAPIGPTEHAVDPSRPSFGPFTFSLIRETKSGRSSTKWVCICGRRIDKDDPKSTASKTSKVVRGETQQGEILRGMNMWLLMWRNVKSRAKPKSRRHVYIPWGTTPLLSNDELWTTHERCSQGWSMDQIRCLWCQGFFIFRQLIFWKQFWQLQFILDL